ncbi:MAG: hypothetical protein Q7U04_17955 [Bacteriovorax sp.]|nr:hypothetical protein [Bacteriovorax sp.]
MKKQLSILGIYREEKYSNRAIDADKAILDEVFNCLKNYTDYSLSLTKIHPEDIGTKVLYFNYDLVFSMAQEENILAYLDILESRGAVVINSANSIRNCFRKKLSEILSDEIFSYPLFISLKVDQVLLKTFDSANGYWVKRGDYHAMIDEDVVHIKNVDELGPVLENFKSRGVSDVILQESLDGELFKFYGIRDCYFNLRYIGKTSTSRYHNSLGNSDIIFDYERLEKLVHRAAQILGLDYFGGDCVISTSGQMHFIDFNDWPSFRTCKTSAAPIMASYAIRKLNNEAEIVSDYI